MVRMMKIGSSWLETQCNIEGLTAPMAQSKPPPLSKYYGLWFVTTVLASVLKL